MWKYCSRGTLQDMIHNEDLSLDAKFHGAFVRDILKVQCRADGVFGSRVIRVVTRDKRDSALRSRACAQRGYAQCA
jgi:hypothetical protein